MREKEKPASGSWQLFPFFKMLFMALGIVVLLFALYRVVDRVWLSDVGMETLHILYRIQGLFTALVISGLVGWYVIRKSQPLLASALSPEEWRVGTWSREQERITVYAHWFIEMRWIAVVVTLTLIVVTVRVVELLPMEVWWPLVFTVTALAVLNLLYTTLLKLGRANKMMLAFQAYIDLVVLTVLLHFSGSLENPLAPLMLFHVIIAGIILSRRQCFSVALLGGSLFAILAALELMGLLHHYTLGIFPHMEHEGSLTHAAQEPLFVVSKVALHAIILLLTAFFVTTLTDRLHKDERQLEGYAERISTERQLLEQALETTGTALCVCNANLEPMWSNRQWDAWFGHVSKDSPSYREIYGPKSPARQTIEDGKVRVSEIYPDTTSLSTETDDSWQTFLSTTAPLINQNGEIDRVVQLVQDITEQKKIQAGLIRAGKLAAVGEMAGEVAHEVNNPIAIISAKTRLLLSNRRNEFSEKVAEELIKITHLAERIAKITHGLLSSSRLSASAHVELDARMPIRKASMLVEQRAREANVDFEDLLPNVPLKVMANADELEQIFLNMFINSLDAMPGGGRLAVSASRNYGDFSIIVEDTGSGILPAIKERVFEPFFTTKPEGDGTGLGLSICAGLIRSHGGSIELADKFDQGTRMIVKLPVYVPDEIKETT